MSELTQAGYDALIEISETGTFHQPDVAALALKANLYSSGFIVFNSEEMKWRLTEDGRTAMLNFYINRLSIFPTEPLP